MWESIRAIHEALGIESTWAFVLVIAAIFGLLTGGLLNGVLSPLEYLKQLNPECVREIHLAGGDELAGFYTDSHSSLTPNEVWSWAYTFGPRFRNLRAIVFEFHESYFEKMGMREITAELERINELAEAVSLGVQQLRAG